MPLKSGDLTDRERMFAEHFGWCGNHLIAAEKAGYAVPSVAASKMKNKPEVMKLANQFRMDSLQECAILSLIHCRRVLTEETAPLKDKTAVARLVFAEVRQGQAVEDLKSPDEMNAGELAEYATRARLQLAAAEQRLSEQAKDVTPEPSSSLLD